MKKLLILMLLGVLFVPMNGSAKADQVFYCQSEVATGMAVKNGNWLTGDFTPQRYTIKFSSDYTIMRGLKNYAGEYSCFHLKEVKSRHICRARRYDMGDTFIFDSESKSFIYSSVSITTYFQPDTPHIQAGTCQKF